MRSGNGKIDGMITIWRRHNDSCPQKRKGRSSLKCSCPLWADGCVDGKRIFRRSLGTRDMARARKRTLALESEDAKPLKPVQEATKAFLDHRLSEGLASSSIRKYRNVLSKLEAFCEENGIDAIGELKAEHLDKFRAGRGLKPITSSKELETLRVFLGFCLDRNWCTENAMSAGAKLGHGAPRARRSAAE